jgi:ATP-dependent DNA helicase RecG
MTQNDLLTRFSSQPISTLRGVGEIVQKKLNHLGIYSVLDLIWHFPLRYEDRTQVTPLAYLQADTNALIMGQLISCQVKLAKRKQLLLQISDNHKTLQIRFFQFTPQMKKMFDQKIGEKLVCFGIVRQFGPFKEMFHPEIKWVQDNYTPPPFLTPIYPSTEGLYQSFWHKLSEQILQQLPLDAPIETDILFSESYNLIQAIRYIHRPPKNAEINKLLAGIHPAQQRLIIEELLAHHLSFKVSKQYLHESHAPILKNNKKKLENFIKQFPFSLTSAQLRVSQEVCHDLEKSDPMLRLVQGDVGSGKTVIAAIAAMQALANGYQVALMAPTELLAQQHAQNFQNWLAKDNQFNIALLSGKLTRKEQQKIYAAIADGQINLVIGTHALFQKDVDFYKLGLIIIDEQHRFGVNQRLALLEKGKQSGFLPHQLIMTATPIPRTLAMTFFANLSYSVIDELPQGRKPITTVVIHSQRRMEIIERIRSFCQNGQQVYWVCTAINENESINLKAAEELAAELHRYLPEIQIALLHGKMKTNEKTATMLAFKAGEIHLLVATTVIEVGVDVPNASLMIIDNAERLGLAQLHQLRGRVGRGSKESYCILLYHPPLSEVAKQRLQTLRETNDGFLLAEKDLQLRGPGEVFGTRQTGLWQLKIADLMRDQHLLQNIPALADQLLDKPHIIQALLTRWLNVNLNLKAV